MKKSGFKMKGFSGFGNSPVKQDEGMSIDDRLKHQELQSKQIDLERKMDADEIETVKHSKNPYAYKISEAIVRGKEKSQQLVERSKAAERINI
jgi:hypothetical protein